MGNGTLRKIGPEVAKEWLDQDSKLGGDDIAEKITAELEGAYETKKERIGADVMRQFEKAVMLQQLDQHWKEHLAAMDFLRQGIGLRGYAQKNPKQEYKREACEMFSLMLDRFKRDTSSILCRVQVQAPEDVDAVAPEKQDQQNLQYRHEQARAPQQQAAAGGGQSGEQQAAASRTRFVREQKKVGRNEPCPCGSGKKYKRCHGRIG